jgi:Holliday junction DNA helicase RuvA
LELKGKAEWAPSLVQSVGSNAQSDVAQALMSLGYSEKEAQAVIKVLPQELGVSEGIKWALKSLSR